MRYARTKLGVFWAVLQSIVLALTISYVFERVFQAGHTVNYPIYVLSGIVPFQFTLMAVTEATSSVVSNASLVRKVALPRAIFPISSVLAVFTIMTAALGVIVVGAALAGTLGFPRVLLLLPTMAVCFGLACAGGLIGAAIYVFRRDVQFGIDAVGRILLYVTPVMYTPDLLSPAAQDLLRWNPMTGALTLSRAAVLGTPIDWPALLIALGYVVVLLPAGLALFNRRSAIYADLV